MFRKGRLHLTILKSWSKRLPFTPQLTCFASAASVGASEDILIVGTGIAGLSSAHFLLGKSTITGDEKQPLLRRVSLIDAFPKEAAGTSRKNGGLLCPSLSYEWTSFPLFRGKDAVLPQLVNFSWGGRARPSPISFDPKLLFDPRLLNFGFHWARRRMKASKQSHHIGSIMDYSMRCFNDREDSIIQSIEFNRLAQGTKTKDGKLATNDSSGDIGMFCKGLARELTATYGEIVDYHFDETVIGLEIEKNKFAAVKTQRNDGEVILHKADKIVIAAGTGSYDICKGIGVQCPVFPVKGYLVTFRSNLYVPHNIELSNKAFVAPFGNGVYRLSGFAEFTSDYRDKNQAMEINKRCVDALLDVAREEFPDLEVLDVDCGYRPMSPDDTPIIGPTSNISNVYLCTGHGSKGWTMGLGSGKLLADLILGNPPEIDASPFDPKRFD